MTAELHAGYREHMRQVARARTARGAGHQAASKGASKTA